MGAIWLLLSSLSSVCWYVGADCTMPSSGGAITAQELVRNMLAAIDDVQGVEMTLVARERIKGQMVDSKSFFRIQTRPRYIYMRAVYPNKGVEVLYREGWNGGKALVYPGGFPWTSLSLSPYGSRMRNNQHHTILEAGFEYIAKGVRATMRLVERQRLRLDDHFKLLGTEAWNGYECYKLFMLNDAFAWGAYTVPRSMTLTDLARELHLSEFMLHERNKIGLSATLSAGTVLQVPNSYAKKVVFYVDKRTYLPLVQFVYDDQGLFEKYEYYDLKVNPKFDANAFSEKNDAYNF